MNNQKIPNTILSIMIALAVVGISSNANAGEPLVCGNGIEEGFEECDDGNMSNTDECLNNCKDAECGDTYIQVGVEECDDGNTMSGDGCDEDCDLEKERPCCGDGVTQGNEECDDGNMSNTDECLTTCELAECGDSYIEMGEEQCDDGNTMSGDGCDENCNLESQEPYCGDGEKQGSEECDDGNMSNTDGCLTTCKLAECGDTYIQMGEEECDDGNTTNGDGCSSTCTKECYDGNDNDGVPACDDLCADTRIPEGVPTKELLPNHYALTDEEFEGGVVNHPFTFDTVVPKSKKFVDSEYTTVDTAGCSCEQILAQKPGNNEGEIKNGCSPGTIKNWIKYVEDGQAAPPADNGLDVEPQANGCNMGQTRNGLALALMGLMLAAVGRRRRS